MKKSLYLFTVLALVLSLAACTTGVSQEDYDALEAAKVALEGEKTTLVGEKADLQAELDSKTVGFANQTVTAYGFTHGGYVGKATVTVTDGVVDVEVDEAFMPHTLAKVTLSTDWTTDNTFEYSTKYGPGYVAKYIEYAGTLYTVVAVGSGFAYVEADATTGDATGSKNLEMEIIRTDASMAAYYTALENGEFKLLKSFNDANPIAVTEGLSKDGNANYWQASASKLGWQANIDALEAFIEENGAAFDTLTFEKETHTVNDIEDEYWVVADTVTGATNSDFQDYFQLVQAAFGQLVTEVK